MNIKSAKLFLNLLHQKGQLYHLDDNAHECIGHLASPKRCDDINEIVEHIFNSNLDWGKFECPHGYCIALINSESHNPLEVLK